MTSDMLLAFILIVQVCGEGKKVGNSLTFACTNSRDVFVHTCTILGSYEK